MGYLEVLRTTLREYGVPEALYTDKAGIFYVNTKKEENWSIDEQLAGKTLDKTQFGRIADKLGMELIRAHLRRLLLMTKWTNCFRCGTSVLRITAGVFRFRTFY